MQVSSISFKANSTAVNNEPKTNLAADKPKKAPLPEKKFLKELGINEPPAIAIGLLSASIWFGIGTLMDKGISKIWKGYKYNAKTSMCINAVFGLVMGTMDFFRARKSQ